ncbi:MAG: hypothetical protein ACJ0A4_05835 [Paracoccaceae bacterium]
MGLMQIIDNCRIFVLTLSIAPISDARFGLLSHRSNSGFPHPGSLPVGYRKLASHLPNTGATPFK